LPSSIAADATGRNGAARPESAPVEPARGRFRHSAAALGAAAVVAAAVAAGVAIGPPALALAMPAAVTAGLGHARAEARARRLHRASRRDALTGLGNRLLLAERLDYEMLRHGRHERPLAAFALDIDGFKAVNDRYGHPAGDEVLVEVARALHRVLRAQDTVARVGGDEFCVLAPETDRYAATQLAERLRAAVAEAVVGIGPLGVSVGFALFPHDARAPQQLLAHADAAALQAKRHARADARRAA
jgi:two-component system cell cycle response regulator